MILETRMPKEEIIPNHELMFISWFIAHGIHDLVVFHFWDLKNKEF
jgi:hypothetical protein